MIKLNHSVTIVPVILCGGSGTRLWPLSRQEYPKQFLKLLGDESLFQQTITRLDPLKLLPNIDLQSPIIVTNEQHRFLVLDQLHEIDQAADIILELVGKNTAPSLTLAALAAQEKYSNPVLMVLPADHTIAAVEQFCATLAVSAQAVYDNKIAIATLGVLPQHPETGYGYIQCQIDSACRRGYYQVERFIEKPDHETAVEYLSQGNFYWNCGIYLTTVTTWLEAMQTLAKDIADTVIEAWLQRKFDIPFVRPAAAIFAQTRSDSIDYAVIEHCTSQNLMLGMVPLDIDWSDLGTWQAVSEHQKSLQADAEDNVAIGDIYLRASRNCYVHSSKRLVTLIGAEDLIVVDTDDALLIAHRSQGQAVKTLVDELARSGRAEVAKHRKVYRPWGWYDSIDECERFKVKRICVKPKASLSLQKHHHRAEHWVVVKGTAEVTCGGETLLLSENQSTYIPLGVTHRLSNPGNIPLEIIEVQSGSYLGEDDIVRLQDDYGRG